jgi:hypothetical protein
VAQASSLAGCGGVSPSSRWFAYEGTAEITQVIDFQDSLGYFQSFFGQDEQNEQDFSDRVRTTLPQGSILFILSFTSFFGEVVAAAPSLCAK